VINHVIIETHGLALYRKIDEPKTPFVSSDQSFPDLGANDSMS